MIDAFKSHRGALEYTTVIDGEVPMLDTKISIIGKRIATTLYTNPTDSHSYLQFSSSHSTSCKKGIPYSQFLRVRRICFNGREFEKQSKFLAQCFLQQGYPKYLVENQRRKAMLMDRKTLIHGIKSLEMKEDIIVFPITYHPTNMEVVEVMKRNFMILKNDDEVGDVFQQPPMVAYRRGKNLRDYLVYSKLKRESAEGGTSKCNHQECLTCRYINSNKLVVGPRGLYTIRHTFTCESKGLVYAIECKRCGELYIGETCRKLKDKFKEHRLDVIRKRADREVASHFNSNDHNVDDMTVMGLRFEDTMISRKLSQQRII